MAAINSVITSALDRAIDRLFDLSTISRYFTTFDPTPQTHISLSSAITLAGDFEMESTITYSASPTSATSILGGALETSYIRFDSTTTFKIGTPSGNSIFITISPALDYTKRNVLRIVKSGTLHTVYLNDVEVGSNTGTSGNLEVSRIGSKGAASFHDGVMSDVKIWDGGDRDTGTLVLDMPIDGSGYGTDTLVDNNQTVLGSELGNTTSLSLTGFGTSNLVTGLVVGKSYTVTVTASSGATGTVGFIYNGVYDSTLDLTSSVSKSFIFTATTTTLAAQGRGDYTGDVTTSIKEIPVATPLGTAVNFVDADSEEFTFQDNGDWLATTSLWNNTPTIGTHWVDNGGGSYTYTGDGSFNTLDEGGFTVGHSYMVSILVSSISGNMKAQFSGVAAGFGTTGNHNLLLQNSPVTDLKFARSSGIASCTMSDISAKRILEAP